MKSFDEFPNTETDPESFQKLQRMADEIYATMPALYEKCLAYIELSSSHRENVGDVRVYALKEIIEGKETNDYILYVTYTDNDEPYSQIISLHANIPEVEHFTQYDWDAIQTIADKYGFGYEVGS